MKKLIAVFFVLALTLALCLAFGGMAYAEEVNNSVDENQQEVDETVYPCKIVDEVKGYGNVIWDIEGGNVGDIVTLTIKPYVFCKLDFIKVNDVDLVPDEDGNYKFALVDGDNVVSAYFNLDPEQMGAMKEYVAQAEEEGIGSLFTMKNLWTLICTVVSFFAGAGWLWQAIRTAKQNKAFTKLNDDVMSSINANLSLYASNVMGPLVNALNLKIENVTAIAGSLAKCMIIAQENTPQARMAIIEELQKVQTLSTELGEQIKQLIQAEIDKKAQELQEQKDTIAELEAKNEAIQVEEPTTTEQKDEYGQF